MAIGRSHTGGVSAARTLCLSLGFVGLWGVSLPQDVRFTAWILLAAGCLALMRVAFEVRHDKAIPSRVLILGSGPLASMVAEEIESNDRSHARTAGMVDDRPPEGPWPWLGRLDCLTEIIERVRADQIVVALEDRRGHLPLSQLLASRVRGVVVEEALAVYERLTASFGS